MLIREVFPLINMNKQLNSQRSMKLVFTQEQIEEQKQFTKDLQQGNVKTTFEGTFLEGKAFLEGTHQLVDRKLH